jgi:Ni/Fe-hydrogenase subunit HybB-like protein
LEDYFNVLAAVVTIFAIALTIVAAVAYSRVRNKRVLFVAAAFALFAIKGIALTLSLINEEISDSYILISVLMDTVIIILLALTVLKP